MRAFFVRKSFLVAFLKLRIQEKAAETRVYNVYEIDDWLKSLVPLLCVDQTGVVILI
jgi:hypothetical protein